MSGLFWGVAAFAGLAAGCSGESHGTGTPVDTSNLSDFLDALAQRFCAASSRCCSTLGKPLDLALCQISTRASFDENLANALAHDTIRIDDAMAQSCLSGIDTMTCDSEVPAACRDTFEGTLAEGSSCLEDFECLASADTIVRCERPTDSEPRQCIVYTDNEGASCDETCTSTPSLHACINRGTSTTSGRCYTNFGLYCDDAGVCRALLADGAACSGNEQCQSGTCVFSICGEAVAIGQACTISSAFEEVCVEGAMCSESELVCRPRLNAGASCQSDSECLSDFCGSDGTCRSTDLSCQ